MDLMNRIRNLCRGAETGDLSVSEEALNDSRGRIIVRTSVIGILANVFLAAFKAVIGLISGSIAIVLDAVNNLSDAASSLITIVGTKLAAKAPDKKHPFGHGRIEYLTAMIISFIVLYAGITSLVESVKKILHPESPDYSTVSLVIVGAAVIVKILLGRYMSAAGKKIHSDSLVNSGKDSLLDSVISASTLAAALVFLKTGLTLEAYLGAVISVIIIKSGFDMLKDTVSRLLGERVDTGLAKEIKATVLSFPEISGVYDLVLNNYGPDTYNGSLHIEVPDTYTADEIDELIRNVTVEVYRKNNVILTAVGVYSLNTGDNEAARMREAVRAAVLSNEYILQFHGFHVNEDNKTLRFDAVVSFDAPDRKKVHEDICQRVSALYPDYTLQVTIDTDFSES